MLNKMLVQPKQAVRRGRERRKQGTPQVTDEQDLVEVRILYGPKGVFLN